MNASRNWRRKKRKIRNGWFVLNPEQVHYHMSRIIIILASVIFAGCTEQPPLAKAILSSGGNKISVCEGPLQEPSCSSLYEWEVGTAATSLAEIDSDTILVSTCNGRPNRNQNCLILSIVVETGEVTDLRAGDMVSFLPVTGEMVFYGPDEGEAKGSVSLLRAPITAPMETES